MEITALNLSVVDQFYVIFCVPLCIKQLCLVNLKQIPDHVHIEPCFVEK